MRAPQPSDFPNSLTTRLTIIPTPGGRPPSNILLLLHGLGDTHRSLATLARQLNLPETLCISLLGPTPLPVGFDVGPSSGGGMQGHHWADDLHFDTSSDAAPVEMDAGFTAARKLIVEDVVKGVLMGKCEVKLREIMLFGFGQGGMAALTAAMAFDGELGGVVSLGGFVSADSSLSDSLRKAGKKCKTPVLLCAGQRGSAVSEAGVRRMKECFESVEVVRWKRAGDGMARNREEMLPIMRFFARRLRSRAGVPEEAVEVE